MRLNQRMIGLTLFAALAMSGCAEGVYYERYYDPYDHVYYAWGAGEDVIYRRWELETHRTHVDFQRRSPAEQHAYWNWRHR